MCHCCIAVCVFLQAGVWALAVRLVVSVTVDCSTNSEVIE
jgi:hypothetical protein